MVKHKNKIVTAVIVLIVLIAIFALIKTISSPSKDVIAVVNGEKIMREEFNVLYDKVKVFDPDTSKDKIVDQLISNKLLLQEAKKEGITVDDKEVEGVISLTESLYGKKIDELLANSSIPLDFFKQKMKEQLAMSKLLNQSIKVEEPTDDELKKFYDDNPNYFMVPEMVNVSQILLKTEDEAKKIKEELASGKDFYKLAAEKSIDPSAKQNSGNLGPIAEGSTVKEFEDVAFSLPAGTISNPTKSQFGYHIIKVEGKTEAKKLGFRDVKDQIKAMAAQQKQQKAIVDFVDSLKNTAKVKKYPENY